MNSIFFNLVKCFCFNKNGRKYILNIKKNSKILLPGYICHVVVDAKKDSNLDVLYYKNKKITLNQTGKI